MRTHTLTLLVKHIFKDDTKAFTLLAINNDVPNNDVL